MSEHAQSRLLLDQPRLLLPSGVQRPHELLAAVLEDPDLCVQLIDVLALSIELVFSVSSQLRQQL